MTGTNVERDRILTVRQTAERLGLCEKSVRREIDRGGLGAVRLGPGKRRIGVPEIRQEPKCAAWLQYGFPKIEYTRFQSQFERVCR